MRSPKPAARTIAVLACVMAAYLSHHERRQGLGGGKLARIEAAEFGQSGVSEVALEVARDPRDMSEITALAVTFRQSRKDAEDLRVSLGAERRVKRDEPIARKVLVLRAPGGTVASEKLPFKRFRNLEPGVLEQRYQVVGQRAEKRVLEVENADLFDAPPAPAATSDWASDSP